MAADALDNPRVFFEIEINGESAGRVVMELYSHVVPKTVRGVCIYGFCLETKAYRGAHMGAAGAYAHMRSLTLTCL